MPMSSTRTAAQMLELYVLAARNIDHLCSWMVYLISEIHHMMCQSIINNIIYELRGSVLYVCAKLNLVMATVCLGGGGGGGGGDTAINICACISKGPKFA